MAWHVQGQYRLLPASHIVVHGMACCVRCMAYAWHAQGGDLHHDGHSLSSPPYIQCMALYTAWHHTVHGMPTQSLAPRMLHHGIVHGTCVAPRMLHQLSMSLVEASQGAYCQGHLHDSAAIYDMQWCYIGHTVVLYMPYSGAIYAIQW